MGTQQFQNQTKKIVPGQFGYMMLINHFILFAALEIYTVLFIKYQILWVVLNIVPFYQVILILCGWELFFFLKSLLIHQPLKPFEEILTILLVTLYFFSFCSSLWVITYIFAFISIYMMSFFLKRKIFWLFIGLLTIFTIIWGYLIFE